MTDAEKARAAKLFRAGKTYRQIGEELHYSASHIAQTLRGMGMCRRPGHYLPAREDARRQAVRNRGMSIEATAEALGIPLTTYKGWLKRKRELEKTW